MQIEPSISCWRMNYLTGRPQFVQLKDCVLDMAMSNTWIVLPSFLFTSDCRCNSELGPLQTFPYDAAVVAYVRNWQEEKYRYPVGSFGKPCKLNRLKLNITKTKRDGYWLQKDWSPLVYCCYWGWVCWDKQLKVFGGALGLQIRRHTGRDRVTSISLKDLGPLMFAGDFWLLNMFY